MESMIIGGAAIIGGTIGSLINAVITTFNLKNRTKAIEDNYISSKELDLRLDTVTLALKHNTESVNKVTRQLENLIEIRITR